MTKFSLRLISFIALTAITLNPTIALAFELDLSGRTKNDTQQDATRKPVDIINFAGVQAGDNVLDLLAGGGYYSELLSRAVGDNGEVALQIPKAYLGFVGKELEQRLANNRLKNVNYILSEAADLKLQEKHFDSAFLVLGYHDMFFKDQGWDFPADVVMPQVMASLKVGGKLLIIDHNAAKSRGIKDTKTLHRIEDSFVINDLKKYGFTFVKQSKLLENSNDDHSTSVFTAEMRRKTDRFVLLFERTK
jgi:predicted methyltransferase